MACSWHVALRAVVVPLLAVAIGQHCEALLYCQTEALEAGLRAGP